MILYNTDETDRRIKTMVPYKSDMNDVIFKDPLKLLMGFCLDGSLNRKLNLIRAINEADICGLKQAKEFVDSLSHTKWQIVMLENVTERTFSNLVRACEDCGVEIILEQAQEVSNDVYKEAMKNRKQDITLGNTVYFKVPNYSLKSNEMIRNIPILCGIVIGISIKAYTSSCKLKLHTLNNAKLDVIVKCSANEDYTLHIDKKDAHLTRDTLIASLIKEAKDKVDIFESFVDPVNVYWEDKE